MTRTNLAKNHDERSVCLPSLSECTPNVILLILLRERFCSASILLLRFRLQNTMAKQEGADVLFSPLEWQHDEKTA